MLKLETWEDLKKAVTDTNQTSAAGLLQVSKSNEEMGRVSQKQSKQKDILRKVKGEFEYRLIRLNVALLQQACTNKVLRVLIAR